MKQLKLLFPLAALSQVAIAGEKNELPNILVIVADDAGYADFGFMGSNDTRTPHLDRLAADGRICTDAHVAATVSSPSRAMLMTGRYGQRFGYECNAGVGQGLPKEEKIIPEILKPYGYRTACIGKWHLGTHPYQHPNAKGFDEFYGLIGGARSYYYEPDKCDRPNSGNRYEHNGEGQPFEGYFTDELTQRAVDFIGQDEQPFMMYLSYTAPHSPNHAKKEDLELFKGQPRAVYAAMLYALDRGIGEVVAELKRTGKYDNTMIFFVSDNGGATTNNASNDPLKGWKGNKFEGGHRVPFLFTWGDRTQSDIPYENLISSLDIFATITDAVGVSKKDIPNELDGVSLLPYLVENRSGKPHDVLFWRKMDSRACRWNDYKLIVTRGVDTVLYDLSMTLDESKNLVSEQPKVLKKMLGMVEKWEKNECIEPMWIEDGWRHITNGYHQTLMEGNIRSFEDYRKSKKKNKK